MRVAGGQEAAQTIVLHKGARYVIEKERSEYDIGVYFSGIEVTLKPKGSQLPALVVDGRRLVYRGNGSHLLDRGEQVKENERTYHDILAGIEDDIE